MTSRADLFVVCKQCGSEVSAYITECPYCGHRLRRRAPKLPREKRSGGKGGTQTPSSLGRLRRGEIPGIRADSPPYATAALVIATCGIWIAWRGGFVDFGKLVVAGPLHGDWWRPITAQFTYASATYQFATLTSIAVFGWLLERRHGSLTVVVLFLACGVGGALVELAVYPFPVVSGGNAAALGLLAAWAAPDLLALRAKSYYDGDLLGAGAFAIVLLLMPLARVEASWVAGVVGGLIGVLFGAGLARASSTR